MPITDHSKAAIDFIFERFQVRGNQHYGEEVTMQQHMLQAATLAEQDGQPPEMVAACLLHDFGHLIHDFADDIADHGIDAVHEELGAQQLGQWFTDPVVEPGRLHVAAKRYICATDPDYLNGLSAASLQSLELQGGPMNEEEIREFESHPFFRESLTLRHYDDLGKQVEMQTPPLEYFRPLLVQLLKK